MKNFEIQWKALEEQKTENAPEVPNITTALPIIKWTEAFQDYLNQHSFHPDFFALLHSVLHMEC